MAAFKVVVSGDRLMPFLILLLLAISFVEKIPHRTPTLLRGISIGPLSLMEVFHPRVIQQSAKFLLPQPDDQWQHLEAWLLVIFRIRGVVLRDY